MTQFILQRKQNMRLGGETGVEIEKIQEGEIEGIILRRHEALFLKIFL